MNLTEDKLEPYCLEHKKFRCGCDDHQFMKYFTRLFSYSKYIDFMADKSKNKVGHIEGIPDNLNKTYEAPYKARARKNNYLSPAYFNTVSDCKFITCSDDDKELILKNQEKAEKWDEVNQGSYLVSYSIMTHEKLVNYQDDHKIVERLKKELENCKERINKATNPLEIQLEIQDKTLLQKILEEKK